jgi:hypothetical protein
METGDPFFEEDLEQLQQAFCEAYLLYRDINVAWEQARGIPITPDGRLEALRWFKDPAIQQLIIDATQRDQELATVTREKHLIFLGRLRDESLRSGKYAVALQAELNRGKAAGFYRQTGRAQDIDGKDLKSLSTDEIRRRLSEDGQSGVRVIEGTVAKKDGG